MSKNQKMLLRIIVSFILYLPTLILHFCNALSATVELLLFLAVYALAGYDVLWRAVKNILHGNVFDENFLMSIATVGAFAIGEYPDAAAVMLLYQIGELFQHYAVGKSRKSIAALMDIRPETATVIRDGIEQEVDPADIAIGETIVVKPGERIPLDGQVADGHARIDTSAITGESVPRSARLGANVISGCISLDGVLYITVQKAYEDSTVSKILELVENATAAKAPTESFITKFSKYYTPVVFALALIIGIVPPLFIGSWNVWLRRAMMFLFVSCPCALVISVPLSFFGGIAAASKKGILVKGSSYIELLSKVDVIAFDKTGTLTKGTFEVDEVYPSERRIEILNTAAIAEQYSNHPIAQSICREGKSELSADVTEIAGKGVCAVTKNGDVILCGNEKLMQDNSIKFTPCNHGTVVYVAKNNIFLGYICIADKLKDDAIQAVNMLSHEKCRTAMLTGDTKQVADEIAHTVGVNEYRYELLPQDKVVIVNEYKQEHTVAFVGDGINDAPVLTSADVGIAMGAMGSDVAIESADVVLMLDNPTAVVTAKKISRKTMKIVKQNIVFSLAVKFAVLILSATGMLDAVSFGMIIAILADVGVCMLAILNAMRAMLVK